MNLVRVTNQSTEVPVKALTEQTLLKCKAITQLNALHIVRISTVPREYGLIGWNGSVLTVT